MRLTLFTPTYAKDFERFSLQRESIRRCGIKIPHIAVVQHDDLPKFKGELPDQENLTLLSTRDVLPPAIERRRGLQGVPRRNPRRWFAGPPLSGWHAQQYVKLAAGQVVNSQAIVCLDCDTVFLRNVGEEEFFAPDGRPYLYETIDDVDAEMAEWVSRSMRFLGVNPQHKPVSRFTHSPTIMDRSVLLDMHAFIAQRHRRPWHEAFDPLNELLMEYSTYGVFAKYVDQSKRVVPSPPSLSVYFWWPHEVAAMEQNFERKVAPPSLKMLAVQSNTNVPVATCRRLLESFWSRQA
jgi:hypothetical protein